MKKEQEILGATEKFSASITKKEALICHVMKKERSCARFTTAPLRNPLEGGAIRGQTGTETYLDLLVK